MPTPSELSPAAPEPRPLAERPPVSDGPERRVVRVSKAFGVSGRRWRAAARWLGLAAFVFGAILLLFVFYQALLGFQEFTRPDSLSAKFNRVAGDDIPAKIAAGIIVIGAEVLRAGYLLLLGLFASLIAARGIQFFAASDAIIDEAIGVGVEET